MSDSKDQKEHLHLSRRGFIRSAGTFLGGAAITAAGCSTLLSRKKEEKIVPPVAVWPVPYKTLDVEDVRGRAFAGYYKGK